MKVCIDATAEMLPPELAALRAWLDSIGHPSEHFSAKFELVDSQPHRKLVFQRFTRGRDGGYVWDGQGIVSEPVEVYLDGKFDPEWLTQFEERRSVEIA